MKRPSVWAGIIGAILIAGNSLNLTTAISQPNDIFIIHVANIATSVAWVIFGGFLVSIYFRGRQDQEQAIKPTHDSPEDLEILRIRRNWILALAITVLFIGSLGSWIVNDYTVGLTILNLEVVFDLVMSSVLLFVAIQLFRGKNVLDHLFYVILFYILIIVFIEVMREMWAGAFINLIGLSYFIYAIKAPLNRKHFRIAHLMILPFFIVATFASVPIANMELNTLAKQESLLEQQFLTVSSTLTNAYTTLKQKDVPDALDIQNVQIAAEKTREKIGEISSTIQAMQVEIEKQFPSVDQKLAVDNLQKSLVFIGVIDAQISKIQELMSYMETLDLINLSRQQRERINALEQEINEFDLQIANAAHELEN